MIGTGILDSVRARLPGAARAGGDPQPFPIDYNRQTRIERGLH
jgi:hypothetical protein